MNIIEGVKISLKKIPYESDIWYYGDVSYAGKLDSLDNVSKKNEKPPNNPDTPSCMKTKD